MVSFLLLPKVKWLMAPYLSLETFCRCASRICSWTFVIPYLYKRYCW